MPIVDAIPNPIPTSVCEVHGEYEHHYLEWLDSNFMELKNCTKCAKEEREEREAKEKEEEMQKKMAARLHRQEAAGISQRCSSVSFNDFIADTPAKEIAKESCLQFARNVYKGEQRSSMIITGKVGTGKTMICQAMVNNLIDHKRCKMIKLIDMIREIKDTWRRDSNISEIDLLARYASYDLLIIDEIGIQFGSDTEGMFVFDVIDGRYQNMLPTVIISNLNIDGVKEKMGERVIDRLRDGGGQLLAFDWESGRK